MLLYYNRGGKMSIYSFTFLLKIANYIYIIDNKFKRCYNYSCKFLALFSEIKIDFRFN
jgi:hypothetical protein